MAFPFDWSRRLKVPLMTAPMFLVSSVELVLAACRSGVLGTFPTNNARTTQMLEQWLHTLSKALTPTDAPWAVNLIVHHRRAHL